MIPEEQQKQMIANIEKLMEAFIQQHPEHHIFFFEKFKQATRERIEKEMAVRQEDNNTMGEFIKSNWVK